MKDYNLKIIIILGALVSVFALNSLLKILSLVSYIPFLILVLSSIIFFLGYEKDNFQSKSITIIITALVISYQIITFSLGLIFGFCLNVLKYDIVSIIKNIIPLILVIIISEIIRNLLLKKVSRKKSYIFIIVFIFILIDLGLITNIPDLSSGENIIKLLFCYVLPISFKNTYLTYQANKFGAKPNVFYRLVMELPIYLFRLSPDLGMYMQSVFNMAFPVALLYINYKLSVNVNHKMIKKKIYLNRIIFEISMFLIIVIVGLFSGWFKYYTLAIATGSMEKNINIGDMVVVKKINKKELSELSVNKIIVFRKQGIVIVHRIARVEQENGRNIYITKGDANEAIDSWKTYESDIIGTAYFKIPFIGYPTIWLSNIIN